MSRIVPKLDLNRTPQLAENYSLVCAKNIRVLKDGTIGPDTNYKAITINSLINSISDDLHTKRIDLGEEITTIEVEIDEIDNELYSDSAERILYDFVNEHTFTYFEANGITLDVMANDDEENDWYCKFEETSGAGTTKDNPIVASIYTKEKPGSGESETGTFLAALKAANHVSGAASITNIVFPYKDLYKSIIKLKASANNAVLSKAIENMEAFGDTRIKYLEELGERVLNSNDSYIIDANKKLFKNIDVTTNEYNEYVIDKYALLYIVAFFQFWIDSSDSRGFIAMLDRAKAKDNENYSLLIQKADLQKQLEQLQKQYNELDALYDKVSDFDFGSSKYEIAAVIPYNTEFYILLKGKSLLDPYSYHHLIIKYDEKTNEGAICSCNWTWNGGDISGVCTVNLKGETLLTIVEAEKNNSLTPIKTINLNISSINDLESIYTQTPEIPIMQLDFAGYYPAKVSPGVYQFFIRYEISENTYTSWFPVTKSLFTARKSKLGTSQGTLKYVDLNIDSDEGFILSINWIYYRTTAVKNSYKRFQVGFLHSSKEGTVARSWKHFNIDTDTIYFDRAEEYIEEIDIKDLTSSLYGIYNVGNITSFRNKIYISNYKETDFNPDELVSYTKTVSVSINTIDITTQNKYKILTNETLIPYQTYAFYIHYVKANGEFTNGYKIGEDVYIDDFIADIYKNCEPWGQGSPVTEDYLISTCNTLIYPTFNFPQNFPDGYVAFFVSIKKVKGKTMQLFNIYTPYSHQAEISGYRAFADCIELDTLLEGVIDNIHIIGKKEEGYTINQEAEGSYHPSGDIQDSFCFGTSGKVAFAFQMIDGYHSEGNFNRFITLDYDAGNNNLTLERCTPIMTTSQYSYGNVFNYINQLHLGGYLCEVYKANVNEYTKYIVDKDWYTKNYNGSYGQSSTLSLTKIDDFSNIQQKEISTLNKIYSNYNLEYLSITETITPKIISNSNKLLFTLNSATLSSIYELKSMFYDYTKKLYLEYNEKNNTVVFDNTIRSSKAIGDEDSINIYKFLSDEYYNVPVDKGKIVNLKAIGNVILVHTQDSLYKFSGNNSLSSSGGEEVQLAETDVFDTGVTELFGSEFGFGGLKNKSHAIASEHSYVFFDADSGNMYMVKGQGELKLISGNIKKLIDAKSLTDIKLASDYYNDRFFVYFPSLYATLSYNYNTNSFVSLHSFKFTKAFNTKTKCYFIYNDNIYVKELVYNIRGISSALEVSGNIFPSFYKVISNKNVERPYVDIIVNETYDAIKTLNYINYIINEITSFSTNVNPINITDEVTMTMNTLNVAQENLAKYMIYAIQIYTNMAATKVMLASYNDDPSQVPENERYLYSTLYPKDKPYYEKGRWNFNYFRNALDTNSQTNSDNASLIYGNYFVVRLIFDPYVDFKLENLNINYGKEYETSFR